VLAPWYCLRTHVLAYGDGATRCAAPARHLRSSHVRGAPLLPVRQTDTGLTGGSGA